MNVFWMTSKSSVWDVRKESCGEELRCNLVVDGHRRSDPAAFRSICCGDAIYCYFTDGKIRGIYSELKCTRSFVARGNGGHFMFKKVRDLAEIVLWEEVCADKILQNTRVVKLQASGTMFALTSAEARAIRRLVDLVDKKHARRCWMYAPGDKACHWEADLEDGVMGLDMDDIPDLRGLSAEQIARKMSINRKCRDCYKGVGRYAARFCCDMQVGDIVFAKSGLHELLGVGVVTGDYLPLPLRDEGIHTRAVRWFVSKKLLRKSFDFGQTALYAVKKNDRAALFAAVGISEYELTKDHGERRGPGETGLSAAEKYALVDETRRACPKKTHAETEGKWQRDDRCVKTAIFNAKFKCERDGRHVTFMRENGNAYLEGHHLVGMRHQGLFKSVSLDNPANIVALCPNCHRLMHFGTDAERKKALRAFYKARKDRLIKAGIKIGEERFIELGLSQ